MLTEFHGDAVTGGSFPALIWKSFVEKALKGVEPQGFPYPAVPYAAPKLVTRRGDRLLLDNGLCRSRQEVVYFAGKGPTKTANCLVNEVEVPDVRRLTAAEAQTRVAAQPLTPKLLYKPAVPLQRPGSSSTSSPKKGYLSAYDRMLLVVTKATQGVIPNLVGKSLDDAQLRLKRLKLEPRIQLARGEHRGGCSSSGRGRPRRRSRRQVSSSSRATTALATRQRPAEVARPRGCVPPGAVGRDADPDPRPRDDLHPRVRRVELERGRIEREPVVLARDAERLTEPPGPGAQQPELGEAAPLAHLLDARARARAPGSEPRPRSPPPRTRG